jgi:hypothetical protein
VRLAELKFKEIHTVECLARNFDLASNQLRAPLLSGFVPYVPGERPVHVGDAKNERTSSKRKPAALPSAVKASAGESECRD